MQGKQPTSSARLFNPDVVKIGGLSALLSGIAFFLTTTYLLVVMPATGWSFDMFDDPNLLFPWLSNNVSVHSGLWILFFITQALLLPVPFTCYILFKRQPGMTSALVRVSSVFGITSVILTLFGPILLLVTAPYLAQIYIESPNLQPIAIVIHNVTANLGMELRLFAEIFVGIWLTATCYGLIKLFRIKWLGRISFMVGIYTFLIATIKIIDHTSALEDTLGLFLSIAYILLGVTLLRIGK